MTELAIRARYMGRKVYEFTRGRAGQIAYYVCIALALAAIAFAAERYRGSREFKAPAPALPAVELSAPEEVADGEEDALVAPEGAGILRVYAGVPEWNAALELWENHVGVDYHLEGDAVESLGAGVVRTVGESGVYGGFVEIECGESLLRYASIAPREGIAPGEAVKIGDIIGTADDSMPGEAELGAHLHLELMRGGIYEDFVACTNGD